MKKINYGKILIELRKSRNLTQQAVADALAVSRPTYISREYNSGEISFSKFIQLSKFYSMSVHVLIQMIYDENNLNHEKENFDSEILKNDIRLIKEVLKKYN